MEHEKYAKYRITIGVLAVFVFIAFLSTGYTFMKAQEQQQQPILGPNYLFIDVFKIGPGQTPNEAIEKVSGFARIMRETGEFKSVRLFIHNTGPELALYLLIEPNNWQAIETGFGKFFEALPDLFDQPLKIGRHYDNLLSEIIVE